MNRCLSVQLYSLERGGGNLVVEDIFTLLLEAASERRGEHLKGFQDFYQGQNLALTVLCVPCSLDRSTGPGRGCRSCWPRGTGAARPTAGPASRNCCTQPSGFSTWCLSSPQWWPHPGAAGKCRSSISEQSDQAFRLCHTRILPRYSPSIGS